LLRDSLLRPRRIGEQDHEAPLASPAAQALLRAMVQRDAIVDHAPYVAQDEAIFWIEAAEETHALKRSGAANLL
jgi:hypothetical protein